MSLGSMNHLSLSVSDFTKSEQFYDSILKFMGYEQVEKTADLILWYKPLGAAITISPANPTSTNRTHDRYSPGLHHFAFGADSREDVDNFYKLLLEMGATILDSPAEYNQYAPSYYAVFFADPDGIKLELVHIPFEP